MPCDNTCIWRKCPRSAPCHVCTFDAAVKPHVAFLLSQAVISHQMPQELHREKADTDTYTYPVCYMRSHLIYLDLTAFKISNSKFLFLHGIPPWTWWPYYIVQTSPMCRTGRMRAWCLFWFLLGLQGSTTRSQGNEICFSPHANWNNLHLTYEDPLRI